jgi:hypothetical protein
MASNKKGITGGKLTIDERGYAKFPPLSSKASAAERRGPTARGERRRSRRQHGRRRLSAPASTPPQSREEEVTRASLDPRHRPQEGRWKRWRFERRRPHASE